MSEIPDRNLLLDEIELRQEDLLRQLDELNQRIEQVLREQTMVMGSTAGGPAALLAGGDGVQPSGLLVTTVQVAGLVDGA
ncbi:MAG: hypothetical protein GTO03_16230 [Planctomycetales bacterium]|nr:hypothetical protein [Planctomycetales bacterium]